jgi:hypothetical protein
MPESERSATIEKRLPGFLDADTSSQIEGYLEPGCYDVEEELKDQGAGKDTDYARVTAPALGAGDTWICTRWRDERYAALEDGVIAAPPSVDRFVGDPLAISESALIDLLPSFHAFRYDLDEAFYPAPLEGARVPLAPPYTNNCCTFVEALVVQAWQKVHPETLQWSAARHRQMMIMSRDDFFSPVTAVVEAGIGVALRAQDPPAPWTLIQGWREQWSKGHTFLIVAHHQETDRVLTLESNAGYELDGVGYRKLGNLRDLPAPPPQWWQNENLWTWKKTRSVYRFNQRAALKVTDRSWA